MLNVENFKNLQEVVRLMQFIKYMSIYVETVNISKNMCSKNLTRPLSFYANSKL